MWEMHRLRFWKSSNNAWKLIIGIQTFHTIFDSVTSEISESVLTWQIIVYQSVPSGDKHSDTVTVQDSYVHLYHSLWRLLQLTLLWLCGVPRILIWKKEKKRKETYTNHYLEYLFNYEQTNSFMYSLINNTFTQDCLRQLPTKIKFYYLHVRTWIIFY